MARHRGPSGKSPFIDQRNVSRETVQFIPAHDGVTRNRDFQPDFQMPMAAKPRAVPGNAVLPYVVNNAYTQASKVVQNPVTPEPVQNIVNNYYNETIVPNPNKAPQDPIGVTPVADLVRYSDFTCVPFVVGVQPLLILQRSDQLRNFLFVLNTDLNATGATIFISFGSSPTSTTGIPLAAVSGSVLFDAAVPQNDVWVIGAAPGITLLLTYGIKAI